MDREEVGKKLAEVVRCIQWSYAIFWCASTNQPGMVEWGDGYYNGEIKTRKTVNGVENSAEEICVQRSEQLRELYIFLSAGEMSYQRPSAALSPEDLTDTEWYYLVCMSFFFHLGQGLPGRTMARGKPIWMCGVDCVDSVVFSRSLLAKSAAIQTVVCLPFSGGVLEFGVTEAVAEDAGIIEYIEAVFSGSCGGISIFSERDGNEVEKEGIYAEEQDVEEEGSMMVGGVKGGASSGWDFMEDTYSNGVVISQSDCISDTLLNHENTTTTLNRRSLCSHGDYNAEEEEYDDDKMGNGSSFTQWKKERRKGREKHRGGGSQKMLKRVLNSHRFKEGFEILQSIVPCKGKVDKISVLEEAIEEVKKLKRRVEELEVVGGKKRKSGEEGWVEVGMKEKEVEVRIRCRWRECLLHEIMDGLSRANLDSYSVQSLVKGGVLCLTIKSKMKMGSGMASQHVLKEEILKVIYRS